MRVPLVAITVINSHGQFWASKSEQQITPPLPPRNLSIQGPVQKWRHLQCPPHLTSLLFLKYSPDPPLPPHDYCSVTFRLTSMRLQKFRHFWTASYSSSSCIVSLNTLSSLLLLLLGFWLVSTWPFTAMWWVTSTSVTLRSKTEAFTYARSTTELGVSSTQQGSTFTVSQFISTLMCCTHYPHFPGCVF